MTATTVLAGERCLIADGSGDPLRDARDLIEAALNERATLVAVPAQRLHPDFFQLRTGVAGELLQKMANYRLRVAVIGDMAPYTQASAAFRDFVVECDRGGDILFVTDLAALRRRLATAP